MKIHREVEKHIRYNAEMFYWRERTIFLKMIRKCHAKWKTWKYSLGNSVFLLIHQALLIHKRLLFSKYWKNKALKKNLTIHGDF